MLGAMIMVAAGRLVILLVVRRSASTSVRSSQRRIQRVDFFRSIRQFHKE
jgi:hypothetical protein